uniref:Replication-associated protein n=1 Tax=Dioscorea persimilis TaxID=374970 RepID=A0A0G2R1Z3_9LILI|nr:replication-associated protein [Dioscorea persimilis]
MPVRPRQFRLNAKNYFLTYARCSLTKEEALRQLLEVSLASNKKYIRVAGELHEDGSPHLHVLIQLEGRAQVTNNRLFDLHSPSSSINFHPNIQSAKSSSDVKEYIEKGGDYMDWGEFQVDGRSTRDGRRSLSTVYADALNCCSAEDALQLIRERDPRAFTLQYHNLQANYDRIFTKPPEKYISNWNYSTFVITPVMNDWINHNFQINDAARPNGDNIIVPKVGLDRPTSLILEGPSRIGKTAWARSLGPHSYISGHLDFNPKVFNNDVFYNVIDDIEPNYLRMKHWKHLIGSQRHWLTNCKYGKPVRIKGGVPSIVLCNPGNDCSYKDYLDRPDQFGLREWTLKNAVFDFIYCPLYQTPESTEDSIGPSSTS